LIDSFIGKSSRILQYTKSGRKKEENITNYQPSQRVNVFL